MLKKLYIISGLAIGLMANAQIDRTKAPVSETAPQINIGKSQQFKLKNGLTVIVVENHKLPTVRVELSLDLPPIAEGNKAGLSEFVGSMMRAGTQHFTKEQLDEKIDFLGSDFWTFDRGAGVSSLTSRLDETLALLQEVVLYPTFTNQEEFDKNVKQVITGLEADAKSSDAISNRVKDVLLYGDHPYGEFMTEESVKNIQLADVQQYYKKYFVTSNAYLVIVGDIKTNEAQKLAEKYFGQMPVGVKATSNFSVPKNIAQTEIDIIDLPSASQSVVSVINLAPLKKSNTDFSAAVLGNFILGGDSKAHLHRNIREDKGWTYGAYSSLTNSKDVIGVFDANAKVRNNVTDSTVVEFMKEIKGIVNNKVTPDELKTAKKQQTGYFAMRLEKPETVANFALTEIKEQLPQGYYQNYLKNIAAVTPEQVQQAMAKYVLPNQSRIVIVGKAEEITAGLKKLGYPVNFFDKYGKPTTEPVAKKVVTDITAAQVVDKYIAAIGGKAKLEIIKNLQQVYTTTLPNGLDLILTDTKVSPNQFVTILTAPAMGNAEVSKNFFDGKSGYEKSLQGQEVYDAEKVKKLAAENALFSQLAYGNQAVLTGIVNIDGKETYEMVVGDKKEYYDTKTALLIREIRKEKQGEQDFEITTNFSDYVEVNGVKIPQTMEVLIPESDAMLLKYKSIELY